MWISIYFISIFLVSYLMTNYTLKTDSVIKLEDLFVILICGILSPLGFIVWSVLTFDRYKHIVIYKAKNCGK